MWYVAVGHRKLRVSQVFNEVTELLSHTSACVSDVSFKVTMLLYLFIYTLCPPGDPQHYSAGPDPGAEWGD